MTVDKKPIMIFAPHPDDDLINCGILMQQALKVNKPLVVVFTTTGARDKSFSKIRKQTILEQYKKIGFNEQSLVFLSYDAFTVSTADVLALYADIKILLTSYDPVQAYIPAYEGGHVDHDITHFIVVHALRVLRKKTVVYEYPGYNNYFGLKKFLLFSLRELLNKVGLRKWAPLIPKQFTPHSTKPFLLKATPDELAMKTHLCLSYHLNERYRAGNSTLVKIRNYPTDVFRKLPQYNYFQPPHKRFPLPLGYELAFKIPFSKVIKALKYIIHHEPIPQ